MAAPTESLLRYLRRLAGGADAEAADDAALLERFARRRDEDAFAALLARHGRLVLGVGRRVLGDVQKAEDVFQATFLALARQAGSLRHPDRLPAWLHGTARRLALQCRRADARRRQREAISGPAPSAGPDPLDELSARELLGVLDEELRSLPEVYRAPLILCYLEGRTHEEAARLLGCTLGSVRGRVERGRLRLHARLVRRGLTLPAALLAAALAQSRAAAVPARLIPVTLQAARQFAAGVRDGVAAEVWALAEAGTGGLAAATLKTGLCVLLTVGLVTGAAALACSTRHELPPEVGQTVEVAQPHPEAVKSVNTDRFGDPLPPGALARMGTVRFRHGGTIERIAVSADGRTLAVACQDGTVRLWDLVTERELRRFPGHEGPLDGFFSLRFVASSPDGKMLATGVSPGGVVRLWDQATGKELRQLRSPRYQRLSHVAFSPDGKLVAASADAYVIMLWETATGRLVHQFEGPENLHLAVPIAFSPDGRMLASGGRGEELRLWDLKTRKEVRRFVVPPPREKKPPATPYRHSGLVQAVVFSPDGRMLATAAKDAPVRLWEVTTGKEVRSLRGDRLGAYVLAFSPDGKLLASGENGTVRLWETTTGKEVRRIQAHRGVVSGLAFIRGGEALATSGDNTIRLWNARTGGEILPHRGHTAGIASSVLLPDSRTLVTGSSDNTVRWWNLATGSELRRVANLADLAQGRGMVLSPNGAVAAYPMEKTAGENVAHVGFQLWDLAARKKLALLWHPNVVEAQFSPDGKTLFTRLWDVNVRDGLILSWDVATGKELRALTRAEKGYLGNFSLSADGKVFAVVAKRPKTAIIEKTIDVLNVATGKELCRLPCNPYFIPCLAISPDNKLLAVADDDVPRQPDSRRPPHYIRLWDIATGKEVRHFGSSSRGYGPIAFSPDGRMLAAAGEDYRLRLWETATGGERLQLAGHSGEVVNLLFAADGRTLISTSSDTTALVWDVTGLRRLIAATDGQRPSRKLTDLWNALADRDAATAYRASWDLTAPQQAVAFLRERLRRVEAPEEKVIAQLVRDLDSPAFATRQRASEELAKLDLLAEPALRQALTGQPSLEMRRRVQQSLEQLEAVPSGAQLRLLRAVEVLEWMGTPAARQVLEGLASGAANARLTREAQAALRRLTARPSSATTGLP